jgi:hypothetical protein
LLLWVLLLMDAATVLCSRSKIQKTETIRRAGIWSVDNEEASTALREVFEIETCHQGFIWLQQTRELRQATAKVESHANVSKLAVHWPSDRSETAHCPPTHTSRSSSTLDTLTTYKTLTLHNFTHYSDETSSPLS